MVEVNFELLTLDRRIDFATELLGHRERAEGWIRRVSNNPDNLFPWIALDETVPVGYTFIKDNHEGGCDQSRQRVGS